MTQNETDKTIWMKDGKPCAFADLDKDVQEGFWAKGFGLSFKEDYQENPLPLTLPHRDELFAAGFVTVDDIPNTAEVLVAIKGIGPKGAEAILATLGIEEDS